MSHTYDNCADLNTLFHLPYIHLLTIELLVLLLKNWSLSDRSNLATKSKTGLVFTADAEKTCRLYLLHGRYGKEKEVRGEKGK